MLAITFALAFDDGQPAFNISSWLANFIRVLFIVIFSVLIKEFVRKYIAGKYDCATEYRIWQLERYGLGRHSTLPKKLLSWDITGIPIGIILPVLIAFISLGKVPFIATGIFIISTHLIHRTGRKYLHITEYEEARIALSAVLASMAIAFAFKFLTPVSPALQQVVTINSLLAFYQMLPFPDLDGSKIFFAGRTFYVFNFIFVIASGILLSFVSVAASVILAIILAVLAATNYHYFLRYK